MNNGLSSGYKEAHPLAWLEGKTIGEVLKERRKDLQGKSDFLSQGRMSQELKKRFARRAPSQGTISYIENDTSFPIDLHPEVRLALLRLYAFTDRELETLNERFCLELPLYANAPRLDSFNHTSEIPDISKSKTFHSVNMVTLKSMGNFIEGGYAVPDVLLKGRISERVIAVAVAGDTLVCPEVRRKYQSKQVLLFDTTLEPSEGDTVLYQLEEDERPILRAYRQQAGVITVQTTDNSDALILRPDDKVRRIGVKFSAVDEGRDAQ